MICSDVISEASNSNSCDTEKQRMFLIVRLAAINIRIDSDARDEIFHNNIFKTNVRLSV